MATNSGTGRLLLAPQDPLQSADPEALLELLRERGFIGAALEPNDSRHRAYSVGERFLQQITFMGCSPHIELSPPADGGHFCHIRIIGPTSTPRLFYGANTQPPRCGACRQRLTDWPDRLAAWQRDPTGRIVTCPKCRQLQRPIDLLWRQNAGYGRLCVAIEDVFPGEAVPVPTLLKALQTLRGSAWHYFYVRDAA